MFKFFKKQVDNPKDTNVKRINDFSQKKLAIYNKNCFYSTFGLQCLLEMILNGSSGEVRDSLQKLFVIDDNKSVMSLVKSGNIFKNMSLIFHASNFKLNNKFIEYLRISNVINDSINLESLEQKIGEINKNLEKMTNNKIKNPLDPKDFDADFVMLLINVLYFKDNWKTQFSKKNTKKILFENGKNEKIDMMCMRGEDFYYYENKTFQYISLPYENDFYQMVIALPKKGENINNVNIEEALKKMDEHTVTTLMLPKFRIEQEEDLSNECKALRLGKMFESNNDFDSMFKDSTEPKRISKIKQKTFVEVDEFGTEAAAVTHAVMEYESCVMKEKLKEVEFIAKHPFAFFIIIDSMVLFAGKFYG